MTRRKPSTKTGTITPMATGFFRVFYMPVGPLPTWLGDFATAELAQAALDEAKQNFLNFRKEEHS